MPRFICARRRREAKAAPYSRSRVARGSRFHQKIDPGTPAIRGAQYLRANFLLAIGDKKTAMSVLKRTIELSPDVVQYRAALTGSPDGGRLSLCSAEARR